MHLDYGMTSGPIMSEFAIGNRLLGTGQQRPDGFRGDQIDFFICYTGGSGQRNQTFILPRSAINNCALEIA